MSVPEDGVEVLVFGPKIGRVLATREWEQGWNPEHWRNSRGVRLELADVTHWMVMRELPAPPVSGADNGITASESLHGPQLEIASLKAELDQAQKRLNFILAYGLPVVSMAGSGLWKYGLHRDSNPVYSSPLIAIDATLRDLETNSK